MARLTSQENEKKSWQQYLSAARRKVEVAVYHLERLRGFLNTDPGPDQWGQSPIEVQAHFEGILFSVVAAEEQAKEAISRGYDVSAKKERAKAYQKVLSAIPRLSDWWKNPLGKDIRCVRNLLTHHYYKKIPANECWVVQKVNSRYRGGRELREYCEATVNYGKELIDLIPDISIELDRLPSSSQPR
ncbi:MAG: hypothetical protein ACLQAT_09040 [Candidatus Binataceae bacterium]